MSKKIIYITDLSLPSTKAQSVHIFKMIDNLLQYLDEAKIICPHKNKEMDEKKYKDYFSLYSKSLLSKKGTLISIPCNIPILSSIWAC